VREERNGMKKEGGKAVEQRKGKVRSVRGRKEEEPAVGNNKQERNVSQNIQFIPKFNSKQEDRRLASSGRVASVIEGDSALSLQHRVEDAGFSHVVVTPRGGDSMFLQHMASL
jgi:hypothetical protein